MGKPRRPRSRPTGTPKPLQAVPASPEIQAADAPNTANQPGPATDRPVEAVQAGVGAVEAVMIEARPDTASEIVAGHTPDARAGVPSEPVAGAATETASGVEAALDIALPPVPAAGPGLAATAAPNRITVAPDRLDVVGIGSTIARYMRGEGEAALAHLRALSGARSPADVIRLQVGEVQRAADASLTCWVTVVGQASRVITHP